MANMQQYTGRVGTDKREHLWKGREEYTQHCYLSIHQISMNDKRLSVPTYYTLCTNFYFGE